jgi:Protein of unknown function (DUF2690)
MLRLKLAIGLFAAISMIMVTSFPLALPALACSGTDCNGTDPNDTGCSSDAGTAATIYPTNSKVELRRSFSCDTMWTRTTNTDSLNRSFYAYATLKFYGMAYEWRNTQAPISKNSFIYTDQQYDPIIGGWQSCGYVGSSYIGYPVYSPCTP